MDKALYKAIDGAIELDWNKFRSGAHTVQNLITHPPIHIVAESTNQKTGLARAASSVAPKNKASAAVNDNDASGSAADAAQNEHMQAASATRAAYMRDAASHDHHAEAPTQARSFEKPYVQVNSASHEGRNFSQNPLEQLEARRDAHAEMLQAENDATPDTMVDGASAREHQTVALDPAMFSLSTH